MRLILPKYIITCNENFDVLENYGICFDEKIIDILPKNELLQKYSNIKPIITNDTLLPGLVNPHIHLEFSCTHNKLFFGDFIGWLNSIFIHRDEIFKDITTKKMEIEIKTMLQSGTTTFGEVSSSGVDIEACVNAKQRVVFFSEALGSNEKFVDNCFEDFIKRFENSKNFKNSRFIPATSIHSAYSTHKNLCKKVVDFTKKEACIISTHFLESKAEQKWLETGNGDFKKFYDNFFPNAKPSHNIDTFLSYFDDLHTLFIHNCLGNKTKNKNHFFVHSPRSNRLLNNPLMDISKLDNFSLATDGLSSNTTLNMWDEMKFSLFAHFEEDLNTFAKKLLISSTRNGAKALGIKTGVIQINYFSDFILIDTPCKVDEDFCAKIILNTTIANTVYISGILVL